ncbi:hypothetical protein V8C86DRAFT_2994930 [Haematococcus lacustris]
MEQSLTTIPQQLAAFLGVPMPVIQGLLSRQPELPHRVDMQLLLRQLRSLQRVLDIGAVEAVNMVARQPSALHIVPTFLAGQLAELADQLGLAPEQLGPLIALQPELLEVEAQRLAARADLLVTLLGLQAASIGPGGYQPGLPVTQRHSSSHLTPAADSEAYGISNTAPHTQRPAQPGPRAAPPRSCEVQAPGLLLPAQPPFLPLPPHMQPSHQALVGRLTAATDTSSTQGAQAPTRGVQPALIGAAGQCRQGMSLDARQAGLRVLARLPPPEFHMLLSLPSSALERRLLQLETVCELGLTDSAADMAARCPSLLVTPLEQIASSCAGLRSLLCEPYVSAAARLRLLQRCPQVLLLAREELAASWAALQQQLGLTPRQLVKRVLQQPSWLKWHPLALQAKLEEVANMLHISVTEAGQAVVATPSLLACSAESLAGKVASLAAVLELDAVQVQELVLRAPVLLTQGTAATAARVHGMAMELQLPVANVKAMCAQQPLLLTHSPAALAHRLAQLGELLQLGQTKSREVVCTWPILLAMPTHELEHNLYELAWSMRQPMASLVSLLQASPWLLSQQLGPDRSVEAGCSRPARAFAELVSTAMRLLAWQMQAVKTTKCNAVVEADQGGCGCACGCVGGRAGHTNTDQVEGGCWASKALQAAAARPELLEAAMCAAGRLGSEHHTLSAPGPCLPSHLAVSRPQHATVSTVMQGGDSRSRGLTL